MTIGVMGCVPSLRDDFPISFSENSGNMIHANAPFEMYGDCIYIRDNIANFRGASNFCDFVNSHCSHLIITMANTLKVGAENGDNFLRSKKFIEQIKKPIAVFGLGVQSMTDDVENATLPKEAVEFIQYLSSRTEVIGVRGEMTKSVLAHTCGVHNVFVTGCPSLFSRPEAIYSLHKNLKDMRGRIAYSGTRYFEDREGVMLSKAIKNDSFLIEPVNKYNHIFYNAIQSNEYTPEKFPYFLKKFLKGEHPALTEEQVVLHYGLRYRLFRNVNDWYTFNKDLVSFTYGTRFHVNMASVISGKPALWVTHDSRTRELTKFLHLPSLPIEVACNLEPDELMSLTNYDDFFNNIEGLFDNFNEYLSIVGLPKILFEASRF